MAGGGAPPPPEAMKRGMSGRVVGVLAVVIAIVAFLAGLGVGAVVYTPRPVVLLVSGHNAPFPPFEEYNDTLGRLVGFNIDIAQEIANATGRQLVTRNFGNFDVLLATVGSNGIDISVASVTITSARNATMDFSDPYWRADQAALENPSMFDLTCADPNNCTPAEIAGSPTDNVIGVQQGTTSDLWVTANVKPLMMDPATNIKRYGNVATEIAALRAGTVGIVIIDKPVAQAYATGGLNVAGTIPTGELWGVVVANNDPQGLLPIINQVLKNLRDSGKYDALVRKWIH